MSVRARALIGAVAISAALFSPGLLAVASQAKTSAAAADSPRILDSVPDVAPPPAPPAPPAPNSDREIRASESPKAIAQRSPLTASIPYQGGPVLHASRTHLVFWAPQGSGLTFDPGYVALVQRFLADVAAASRMTTNEYAISGQYSDASGPAAYASTYAGSVLDTDPLPANECTEPATAPPWSVCLTDAQLQDELEHVITVNRLPPGGDNIYFLVTPNGYR